MAQLSIADLDTHVQLFYEGRGADVCTRCIYNTRMATVLTLYSAIAKSCPAGLEPGELGPPVLHFLVY